ncbi:Citryl-CoA lyase beta subunit-like protein [Acidilobus saccharovorans 345-15]|uniref:Citryl-CoA lyase beta subunit-like protein n=1 Tax=Acidilobus saccharovorans (strain DSM 16705 / JCM 18335 / VKM B-2471 / 345-15) TaxID=666510 RepID=D9PZ54_ACIS3|nr:CoA ester lyase [Acidilobus saccharovorans]ADL19841.1 Citryl-CoA lyase beta subunit-like protein [Acidilobus saccharovorans 345-15]
MRRRSQLYVPGNNEHMIRKSTELEADSVIIDLEDAVPPDKKDEARDLLRRLVKELDWGRRELAVRVNSPSTKEGLKDLALLSELDVDLVVIPKAEGDLSFIHRSLGVSLEPIVETARGLARIEDLVTSEGVAAITYGPADLALSVGGQAQRYQRNEYAKTAIVVYAKAYGVDPIDSVFFDLRDLAGFEAECREARALGYVGKQVIHPSQIPIANAVFTPSKEELELAREIVKAYESAARQGRGAIRFRDQLVDYVHYATAKRLLEDYGEGA